MVRLKRLLLFQKDGALLHKPVRLLPQKGVELRQLKDGAEDIKKRGLKQIRKQKVTQPVKKQVAVDAGPDKQRAVKGGGQKRERVGL